MARVLLDESIPRPLGAHLPGHEVETVPGRGWGGVGNGELIRSAAAEFDVLVTGDQSLQHQQNLSGLELGIVVVAAPDNRVETYLALASRILEAIASVESGSVVSVTA